MSSKSLLLQNAVRLVTVLALLSLVFLMPNHPIRGLSPQATPGSAAPVDPDRNRNPRPDSGNRSGPGTVPQLAVESQDHSPAHASLEPEHEVRPSHISVTLGPGESHDDQIQVVTGDAPVAKGDVMFVFDRTTSMADEIDEAKASAVQIMNDIRAQLAKSWFGVGSFMDYPGCYSYPGYSECYGSASRGDVPWEVNIHPTDSIADVASAINGLWLGWGMDWPEDYTRVLYEVISVHWRPHTKKMVILFGDAPTHDLSFAGYNFGGDPGRDAVALTDDDLDFETVVQQVADEGISVIAVDSGDSAESRATFRGMSIGYGTAPGTNGHYFNLDDSSHIPAVVAQLISEETQKIDRLWLQVTEGYESWIEITPEQFVNVGANTTKTFSISITVPDGTTPGLYPFLIQAIGDGAILGLTHVEVTVPTDSPIDDLGFRPNRDGFRFGNEGRILTWEMFRQFFGAPQVEHSNGNRIHAADIFFQESYRNIGAGGTCDGFTATSLLNYAGLSQPNAGDFALPRYSPLYSKNQDDEIWEAIAFGQGIQAGLEIPSYRHTTCELLGNSPRAMYQHLRAHIENNTPVELVVGWDRDYYAYFPEKRMLEANHSHSLVPYRLEEPSNDEAYVYVYDSNLPGNDKHRIEIDLRNDEWTYRWPVLLWPDIVIEGDATKCLLYITPIDLYRHQGVPFWAQAGWSVLASATAGTASPQIFGTVGPARLLFTDDEGRRLGWDGTDFYDDIPGASYIPVANGGSSEASGFYYISSDVLYDLEVVGYGEGEADIRAWGDGHMVELTGLEVVTGTVHSVGLSSDGSVLSVGSATNDTSLSMSISRILDDEDRTVTIGDLSTGPGEETMLEATLSDAAGSSDTIKLSSTSSTAPIYQLSLMRAGGEGYSSFGHAGLILDTDSDQYIEIDDWTGLDLLTVLVDTDRDGTIDESRPAENQAAVESIALQPSKTVLHTDGEQLDIVAYVKDQFGSYVADHTQVSINTSLGRLSTSTAETVGGLVHFSLTSGSQEGIATLTARVGDVQTSVDIPVLAFDEQTYLPSIMGDRASWSWHRGAGRKEWRVYGLTAADATCNTLYAATDAGLYKSTSRGRSWQASGLRSLLVASSAELPEARPTFDDIDEAGAATLTPAVAVCPSDSQTVYAATWGSGVYKSTDAGTIWQERSSGINDRWIYALAVHPQHCQIVYAGTNVGGVFKSTNGGNSWTPVNSGLANLNVRSLAIAPSNPAVLYAGTTNGVFKTTDGGNHWSPTGTLPGDRVRALGVHPSNPQVVYAGLIGHGLYKSTNGGSWWQPKTSGLGYDQARALAIDPLAPSTVYVGWDDGGGVYRSTNGGDNWSQWNRSLTERDVKSLLVDGGWCNTLHAGTTNGAWYYGP